jgi:hypothetical protein
MKRLFAVAGVAEVLGGLAFVLTPTLQAELFFGASINGPAESVMARVMGLAMMALGLAFWQGRTEPQASTARGMAVVVLVYNTAVAILLVASAVLSHLSAAALWPATGLHAALAVWCAWNLRTGGLRRPSADG